ncbi:fluoride efflux transporter FluC [Streptomyces sp. NPDC090493]|uniref:fluoride efflux transporter FluC n=1 Tax=Streptomyces sp. NPDC090493 TaxID=3365964 RepID=UPI00381A9D15
MTEVREPFRARLRGGVLAAVAPGGLLGGTARYALVQAFPAPGGAFPWTTFAVHVSGAFLPALLVVYVFEIRPPTRYVRPFAAVGFLGAFTTFSTWTVDTDRLLSHGHCAAAALNIFGSLFAGLAATVLGLAVGALPLSPRSVTNWSTCATKGWSAHPCCTPFRVLRWGLRRLRGRSPSGRCETATRRSTPGRPVLDTGMCETSP